MQAPAAASPVSDLLDVLLANGTITQAQYDTLKERFAAKHEAEMAKHEAQMAAQPAQPAPMMVMPTNVVTAMDNGVGLNIGRYALSFSGEINGFYVHDRSDRSSNNDGGCVLCLAVNGQLPNSSLRNGLLPGDLNIKISTKEAGWDVAVDFGIWPGIESLLTSPAGMNLAGGQPTGFGVEGVDFRQQYITFGRHGVGTFKVGRDLGFFGQEAILNDMTIFGAGNTNGAGPGNANPGAVTLGRIGIGYLYTDFMPQIGYTSPSMAGLQVSGAIFQPLSDIVPTALGLPQYSAPLTGHGQPQYQIKATYAAPKIAGIKAKFWTNYLTQSMEADQSDINAECRGSLSPNCAPGDSRLLIPVGQSVRANGVDYGVNASFHGFDFVGYGYNGSGIGTEGLLFLATSRSGSKRDSQGYYLQGTYTVAKKWTLGASYGQSNLILADEELAKHEEYSPTLMKDNGSYVGQVRYGLTSWVNLVGEYTHSRSDSQRGLVSTDDSFALGSIAFF
jgi:predicted porin